MSLIHKVALVGAGVPPQCSAGASSIDDLECIEISGDAKVGAKWDADGDVYQRECTTLWGSPESTWIGDCANTEYEGSYIVVAGDDPSDESQGEGVWLTMDNGLWIAHLAEPEGDSEFIGTYTFQLRRRVSQVIVLTDTFDMHAETE